MAYLKYLPWAGWLFAALFGWLWLQARDDIAEAKQLCNTEKITAVAEAERIARRAAQKASDETIADLVQRLENERKARQIALQAASEAESRPARVETVIRRVADAHSCIDLPIPDAVIDSLRD